MKTVNLVIVGAGGLGEELVSIVNDINAKSSDSYINLLGFVDDDPKKGNREYIGLPVLGSSNVVINDLDKSTMFHCALGSNIDRKKIANAWENNGFEALTIIHPTASVCQNVEIGAGSYVGPFTYIATKAKIWGHVLINSHCVVGHHVELREYSQLCPGACVTGGCVIDEGAFIGSNAATFPGKHVGKMATLGSNSFATNDLENETISIGVPAKRIR